MTTQELEVERLDPRKKALTADEPELEASAADTSGLESLPASVRDGAHLEQQGENVRVFSDPAKTRELFSATADRLRTQAANERTIAIMIAVAQHREWDQIAVYGAEAFRKEAWMEASARGLVVTGYKPTELDLKAMEERRERYRSQEANRAAREAEKAAERPAGQREHSEAPERQAAERVDLKDSVAGVLKEHGTRPYQDNEQNEPSPFVVLDTPTGEKTLWGVGLPDALELEDEVNRSGLPEKNNTEELLKRQAIETQIERNLRLKHPENETLVEKGMERARDAMDRLQRHGKALPEIMVADRTVERAVETEIDRGNAGLTAADMAKNIRVQEQTRDKGLER